jgi:hypothetical protein
MGLSGNWSMTQDPSQRQLVRDVKQALIPTRSRHDKFSVQVSFSFEILFGVSSSHNAVSTVSSKGGRCGGIAMGGTRTQETGENE